MKMTIAAVATAFAAIGIGTVSAACPASPESYGVSAVIDDWQRHNNVAIPTAVKSKIVEEFNCAANELKSEKGTDPATIEEVASNVVDEYLGRTINDERKARSMGAILRSQLGAAGLSRPKVKKYGLVRIEYDKQVDALRIADQTMDPWEQFLVDIGRIRIVGLSMGREVCAGSVEVTVFTPAHFKC